MWLQGASHIPLELLACMLAGGGDEEGHRFAVLEGALWTQLLGWWTSPGCGMRGATCNKWLGSIPTRHLSPPPNIACIQPQIFADAQLVPFFEGMCAAGLRHKQETMMEILFGGSVRRWRATP